MKHATVRYRSPAQPDVVALDASYESLIAAHVEDVTHGGANALMEAMTFGVPVLVLPMGADQPLQGYFAEKAGIGCAVSQSTVDRAGLVDRLAPLLASTSPCKQAALRVRASYQLADGAGEVARRLVALAGHTR